MEQGRQFVKKNEETNGIIDPKHLEQMNNHFKFDHLINTSDS